MSEPYVLVIGAANLDMKGRATQPLAAGTSTPGRIRTSVGGVARNIAENLARLGVPTVLLTAIGDDRSGERIKASAAAAGIDVSHTLVLSNGSTSAYMAVLDENGALIYALDDMRMAAAIRPSYLHHKRRLFRDAAMVVIDANLLPETMATVFRLARQYRLPVCADPTSATLAVRLSPYMSELLLITPNVREAESLCGFAIREDDRDSVLAATKCLVAQGVEIAAITMAEYGLTYATTEESGYVPSVQTEVVDLTGAGDALTAAVVFALLNDIPVSEAMRLGCSAASLTVARDQTVVSDLTLEMLYDNLSP